jgi:hypothetical protein
LASDYQNSGGTYASIFRIKTVVLTYQTAWCHNSDNHNMNHTTTSNLTGNLLLKAWILLMSVTVERGGIQWLRAESGC